MQSFKKVGGLEESTAKFQENVSASLDTLNNLPILDGVLLQNIQLVSGQPNEVAHLLGRNYRGFLVVDSSADSRFWSAASTFRARFIDIRCSANTTVNLWIF